MLDDYVILGHGGRAQAVDRRARRRVAGRRRPLQGRDSTTSPDDRLAQFYLDTKTLIDQAVKQDPEAKQQLQQIRGVLPLDKIGAVTGAFSADGDQLALDTLTSAEGGEIFRKFGGCSAAPARRR